MYKIAFCRKENVTTPIIFVREPFSKFFKCLNKSTVQKE